MGKISKILLLVSFILVFHALTITADVKLTDGEISNLKKFGEKFKKTINADVYPCADYHGHVCEHYEEGKKSKKLEDDDIKEILEKYIINKSDKTETEIKMENFLKSCLNLKGKQDVKEFLQNSNFIGPKGNWPVFESTWKSTEFDSLKAVEKLYTYGIQSFFTTYAPLHIFTIFPKTSSFTGTLSKEETEMLKTIFKKYGFDNIDNILDDYLAFEKAVKTGIEEAKKASESDKTENSYSDFKQQFNEINWDNILKWSGVNLDEKKIVAVEQPKVLKTILTVIKDTDRKIVANYVFVKMMILLNEVQGLRDSCYQQLADNFKPVLTRAVVNNFCADDCKKEFLDIVRFIANGFKEKFGYFKDEGIDKVVDKVKTAMDTKLIPSLEQENLNKEYGKVETDPNDYYKTLLDLLAFNYRPNSNRVLYIHDYDMRPLSGSTLSHLFTDTIYKYRNLPASIIYKEIVRYISMDFEHATTSEVINVSSKKCIEEFGDESVKDLPFSIAEKKIVLLKAYNDWEKSIQDRIQEEDKILKEFGLSNRKVLYATIAQAECSPEPGNMLQPKLPTQIYKFLDEFMKEYSCVADDPMNLVSKCMF